MIKRMFAAAAALIMAAAPIAALAQSNDGYNRYIRVENHSGINQPLVSVHMRNSRGQIYRVLPSGYTINPGYNRTLNFDDGQGNCYFDIEAHFANGTHAYRSNVNVCAVVSWRIFDLDNTIHYPDLNRI